MTIFSRHILKFKEDSEFTENSDVLDLNEKPVFSNGYDVIMNQNNCFDKNQAKSKSLAALVTIFIIYHFMIPMGRISL